jgi:hypothetical protein
VRVVAVLALGLLASCALAPSAGPLPERLDRRLRTADPIHPAFEQALEDHRGFFEALLQVDQLIYPDLDVPAAREAFARLCRGTDCDLGEGGADTARAAVAFLKTLDRNEFVYDSVPPRFPGGPDCGVVSYALLRRTGNCGSFSLLCLAYLESRGLEARLVCVPDHCYLRFGQGADAEEIECTDFDRPIRPLVAAPAGREGHCGRPLGESQTLWHYYVDRLWSWVPWRSTDSFARRAIERGRSILGSSCGSLDAQEAARASASGG